MWQTLKIVNLYKSLRTRDLKNQIETEILLVCLTNVNKTWYDPCLYNKEL